MFHAPRLQFVPKLPEVVDLAVVNQLVSAAGVGKGLVGALVKVDERQPGMHQTDATVDEDSLVIRAPM